VPNYYIERSIYIVKEQREKLKSAGGGCLPSSVQATILDATISYMMKQLVEGYSKVKKYTAAGRRLMGIDATSLMAGIETILATTDTRNKTIALRDYVQKYIAAGLSKPEEIVDFIVQNPVSYTILRRD
jgi:hypothetical protein